MKQTPQTPEVVWPFLQALERPSKKLTAWELGFLESVSEQFQRTGGLSSKQFSLLEALFTEKTP